MDRELRQLRDAAEQLRLVSAGTLFNRARADGARRRSRTVQEDRLRGRGGDIRLDSHVLATSRARWCRSSATRSPTESSRASGRAAGKPAAGHIALEVSRRGRRIVFACRDDGAASTSTRCGAWRRSAACLSAARERLAAEELIRLLLARRHQHVRAPSPRSPAAASASMSCARRWSGSAGEVVVRTEPGKGTTFELVVPPSLASLEALVVEASGPPAACRSTPCGVPSMSTQEHFPGLIGQFDRLRG